MRLTASDSALALADVVSVAEGAAAVVTVVGDAAVDSAAEAEAEEDS